LSLDGDASKVHGSQRRKAIGGRLLIRIGSVRVIDATVIRHPNFFGRTRNCYLVFVVRSRDARSYRLQCQRRVRRGHDCVGIDVNEKLVAIGVRRVRGLSAKHPYLRGDANLPRWAGPWKHEREICQKRRR
jgi:hypothetical protein